MAHHFEPLEPRTLLAGTTLVTHGYQFGGGTADWVETMIDAMIGSIGMSSIDVTSSRVGITNDGIGFSLSPRNGSIFTPNQTPTGESFISLQWGAASDNFAPLGFDEEVPVRGDHVALTTLNALLSLSLLAAPLHLIGHSRGSSVVSELSRMLGEMGIWVDQLTLLDPHPLVAGDPGVQPYEVDPPVAIWSNVRFADNYWSTRDGLIWDPDGQTVPGAADFNLDQAAGPEIDHGDTHAFYHGTIDHSAGNDGHDLTIYGTWYGTAATGPRDQIGFSHARIANQNRSTSLAIGGLHTAFGGIGVRVSAPFPPGIPQWPNVADIRMVGPATLVSGELAKTTFNFGDRDSAATVTLMLDTDLNPYNGFVREVAAADMARSDFASGEVSWSTAGIAPGTYTLMAKVTDGARTRYDQLPELITIAAPPQPTHRLFFPEGYNGGNVNEYVPMVNPNPFPVSYTVYARYEKGARDQILATGTLAANARDGITITEANHRDRSLTRPDTPYAVEVVSSAPLGASMSHYDFGVATGEPFVSQTSESWHFASVNRLNGARDFIVWFNPSDVDTTVTIRTVRNDGSSFEYRWTLGALRRGGIDIQGEPGLPVGEFSVTIECDQPIVAALSHYQNGGLGAIELGAPTASTTTTVLPVGAGGTNQTLTIALFNPGRAASNVSMVMRYDDGGIAPATTVSLAPGQRGTLSGSVLGFTNGRSGSLHITSGHGVVASQRVLNTSRGDSLGTPAFAAASTGWLFADGYIYPGAAGTDYTETVTIYNPAPVQQSVTATYFFLSGAEVAVSHVVPAGRSITLALHEEAVLLNRLAASGKNWFAMRVSATLPIAASMVHWDKTLQGGWQSNGTPITSPMLL